MNDLLFAEHHVSIPVHSYAIKSRQCFKESELSCRRWSGESMIPVRNVLGIRVNPDGQHRAGSQNVTPVRIQ